MEAACVLEAFPKLNDTQRIQFQQLGDLYSDWNTKINVISRKDIENLYPRHVMHSLAIARFTRFLPGTEILDLGTGGGFPGIPLAIFFPEVQFHLIDGTKKKLSVVEAVVEATGLKNVKVYHKRAEEFRHPCDFVVSRAVASLDKLWEWSEKLITQKHRNALPNGLIALKGGDIKLEAKSLPKGTYYEMEELGTLHSFFREDEFFEQKYLVYIQK